MRTTSSPTRTLMATLAVRVSLNPSLVLSEHAVAVGRERGGAGRREAEGAVEQHPDALPRDVAARVAALDDEPVGAVGATRPPPDVTRPSQVTAYSCACFARQPCSQRTTSPPASRMPTRTLQASAGLYVTFAVSVWPSPLGLKVRGAADAPARRGAAVSRVTVAAAEASSAPAVSSAVYAPSASRSPPEAPSHVIAAASPWPLHDATVWPPASRTTSCQSAAAERATENSTVSSTPSPLGLTSAALGDERRRERRAHALGHVGAHRGEERVEGVARALGVVRLAVAGDDGERDRGALLVLLGGAAGEGRRAGCAETGDPQLPGEQALERRHRLGGRRGVRVGAHDRDPGAAGVEAEHVRADDAAGDPPVPALVDGPEPVDEEVVADVAPAEAPGVVRVDGTHQRGRVGRGVGAVAGRVVDERHLDRGVGGRSRAQALVGAPLRAGHDDRRAGRRDGRLVEADAGDGGGDAAHGAGEPLRDAGRRGVGSMATRRTPVSAAGLPAPPAASIWTYLASPVQTGSVKARTDPPSSTTSSGSADQRPPGRAVRARPDADGDDAGRRGVAEDGGDGEGLAGVEDRRSRDGPAGGAGDAEPGAVRQADAVQADRLRLHPGGRRAAGPRSDPRGGQQRRRDRGRGEHDAGDARLSQPACACDPQGRPPSARWSLITQTPEDGRSLAPAGVTSCFNGVGRPPRPLERKPGSGRLMDLHG